MSLTLTPATIVLIILSLVISITLHEMAHAYIGLKLGDTTAQEHGRISFNPLHHIDPYMTILLPAITLILFQAPIMAARPVPFNPQRLRFDEFGAALLALAGPLTNFVLAVIGVILAHLTGLAPAMNNFLGIFILINVALFVFNLVPIPPLDGSRVLYAVAPEGIQNAMAQLEQFGFFIIFALVLFVPAFSNLLANINGSIINFLVGSLL